MLTGFFFLRVLHYSFKNRSSLIRECRRRSATRLLPGRYDIGEKLKQEEFYRYIFIVSCTIFHHNALLEIDENDSSDTDNF